MRAMTAVAASSVPCRRLRQWHEPLHLLDGLYPLFSQVNNGLHDMVSIPGELSPCLPGSVSWSHEGVTGRVSN